MRILHTSDWHLGKSLENRSRLQEQRDFIDELCHIVEEKDIHLVLIAGDIFDTYNPSSAAEELFYDAVDRLSNKGERAVIVIAGNHDNPERLCAASPLAYKNGIILIGYPSSDPGSDYMKSENISIVNSGTGWLELNIEGCEDNAVIITLPYPSESRLEVVLSEEISEEKLQRAYSEKVGSILEKLSRKYRDDTVNLMISHLFLLGGRESESERTIQVGGALTVSPDVLPVNAHYVALGHLHRPQQIKSAPCPTYYSGSPLAYSFSEADHRKAVFVIEAAPGREAIIEPIYLNAGKPLKCWKAKNGIEEAMQWCECGKDSNAWIDLEVYTDRVLTSEEQNRLRALNPGIINIRPIIVSEEQQVLSFQNRENRRIDELFMEYYRFKTGAEISEELMDIFVEILNDENEEEKVTEDSSLQIS